MSVPRGPKMDMSAPEVTGDLDTEDRCAGRSGDDPRRGDLDDGGIKDRVREKGFLADHFLTSPARLETRRSVRMACRRLVC
jgi:hypothetical protein